MPDGTVVDMPDQLDPALGARLRAFQQSTVPMQDRVPLPADSPLRTPEPTTKPDDRGFITRLWDEFTNDPIVRMWGHGLTNIAAGAPDTAAAMTANAATDALGGIGSIGDMVLHPFEPERWDESLRYARSEFPKFGNPEFDAQGNPIQYNGFGPQTESGRAVTEGLGEALAPVADLKRDLGEGALELTGSPLVATLADFAPDFFATLLGGRTGVPRGPKVSEAVPGQAPGLLAAERTVKPVIDAQPALDAAIEAGDPRAYARNVTQLGEDLAGGPVPPLAANDPVVRARRAGYKVLPSDAERLHMGDVPGKKREKLQPTDKQRDIVIDSSRNTNRLATDDLNDLGAKVGPNERLTPEVFDRADEPHIAVYREGESKAKRAPLSDEFQALLAQGAKEVGAEGGITKTISDLRKQSKRYSDVNNPSPENDAYAAKLMDLADEIEAKFGEHLAKVGEPDYLNRFRAAREAMAKINDWRAATRAGVVDPAIVFKRGNKGSKLSGRLKMVSEAHEHFPDTVRSSLSSAGKLAQVEPSFARGAKDLATKIARNIPLLGDTLDVLSEGFQNKLGRKATPAEESYFATYGRYPDLPERKLPDMPTEQADAFGTAFEFETPEGQVGRLPPKPMPTQQVEGLGTALDLERPPGTAPAIPKRDITVQEEEFTPGMDLAPPPGRVGKPKKGIDVRTGVKGAKSKSEIDELTDLTPEEIEYLRSILGD